jgi:hypothetical protein
MAGGDEKKTEELVQPAAKDGTRVIMKYLVLCLLTVVTLLAAQGKQTFTGVVTDDECGRAGHTRMRMGPTDAECAIACVKDHGGQFVLFDGKELYRVSDQQAAEKFAGQKVTVVGTLDAKTKMIQVDSMTAAAR